MPDHQVLLEVLTRFSRTLAGRYDISDVLYELSDTASEILGAAGVGVSLGDDGGRLRFATASNQTITHVEHVQQDSQSGPCHVAFNTGHAVYVPDLSQSSDWPELRDAALRNGLVSVAGVPLTLGETTIGSLNIYDDKVRDWNSDDDLTVQVLANMATAYVAHASQLDQANRINEQLQTALDNRVLIEQAKGILTGERNITLDEAFNVLRNHARSHNVSVGSIAHAVVELGLRP
jgi:GAF domain-containing protein